MNDTLLLRPRSHRPSDLASLPVQPWPGALPSLTDGLCVIGVHTDADRPRARHQIRLALREVLAGLLDMAPDAIALPVTPGRAPRIIYADAGATGGIGCSISHASGLSLAAINLHGAVGVDVMRVEEIADWEVVARDYLGAETARMLAQIAPDRRAAAFARAWAAREASLKCLGMALREWTPTPLACRRLELILPAAHAGAIAVDLQP